MKFGERLPEIGEGILFVDDPAERPLICVRKSDTYGGRIYRRPSGVLIELSDRGLANSDTTLLVLRQDPTRFDRVLRR